MFSIKIRPEGYQELQQAKEWYEDQHPDLGQEFKLATNSKIDYIAKYPYHFQVKWRRIRVAFLKRFPYGVYFIVEEKKRQIVIIGVMHTKKNPKYIRNKRKE